MTGGTGSGSGEAATAGAAGLSLGCSTGDTGTTTAGETGATGTTTGGAGTAETGGADTSFVDAAASGAADSPRCAGANAIAATNDEAESYLKALGDRLQASGFAVATLALTSMNQLPGGGPWRFRCRILPKSSEGMP